MSAENIQTSLNPFTPLMKSNPYLTFDSWRAENPLLWSDEITAWLVTGYAAAKQILDDHENFSSGNSLYGGPEEDHPEIPQIISMDGERHKRLRNLVTKAFNWRSVGSLQPRIDEIAESLLKDIPDGEVFDFVERFAAPLPIIVISEMMGLDTSPEKINHYKEMTDGLADCLGVPAMTQPLYQPGLSAREIKKKRYATFDKRIGEFFAVETMQRWENPGDDLIGKLIKADVDGQKLEMLDIVAFCSLLFVAGNLTTTSMIGTTGYVLAQDQQQMTQLRENIDNDDYVKRFIMETIRYEGPGQSSYRKATRDATIAGVDIRKGDNLLVMYAAANNDPAMFSQPRSFNPERPNLQKHLAFGGGIHYCLGAALAHVEGAAVVKSLAQTFDRLDLPAGYTPAWRPSPFFQGLSELKLTAIFSTKP